MFKYREINDLPQNDMNHQQKYRSSVRIIRTGSFIIQFRMHFIEIIKVQ